MLPAMLRHHRVSIGLILAGLGAACGGPPAPVEPAATPSPPPSPAAQPADSESRASSEPTEAEPSSEELEDIAALEASEPDPSTTPRQVKYVMGNEGLRVEVEGVRLVPKAEPVRRGRGWGVRVRVVASAMDGQPHSVLDPERGPLAFAGRVLENGQASPFGDNRKGDAELVLPSDKPRTFERTWPDQGQPALASGQTLELEVGLWGLGHSAETRRALRKLLRLKMVAGKNEPQPVILPPDEAGGAD
jgi:hypothetical protein